jgi:hypothetical protein
MDMETTMTTTPTPELAKRLLIAQLKHARELINDFIDRDGAVGDDSYDYLSGALRLSDTLLWAHYDSDTDAGVKKLIDVLHTPEGLDEFACDGVCQEVWDLRPDNDD